MREPQQLQLCVMLALRPPLAHFQSSNINTMRPRVVSRMLAVVVDVSSGRAIIRCQVSESAHQSVVLWVQRRSIRRKTDLSFAFFTSVEIVYFLCEAFNTTSQVLP